MRKINITFIFIIAVTFLTSCASKKKILYMQDAIANVETKDYEAILQPDDVLLIIVSSENPEVAASYNLASVTMQGSTESSITERRLQTYVIDKTGNIEFPVIGTVKLAGLTKLQAIAHIKDLLKEHVADAIVNLRILNFEVTVLGEVSKPGSYTINSERVTLLEALGKAGDLTVYGNRENVTIVRQTDDGKTSAYKVDLTKSDFVTSPYYYLRQNDVVYVEPNKTRVNSSVIGPNLTVGISALSLIVTIIALSIR